MYLFWLKTDLSRYRYMYLFWLNTDLSRYRSFFRCHICLVSCQYHDNLSISLLSQFLHPVYGSTERFLKGEHKYSTENISTTLGAFCNTFYMHLAINGLEKYFLVFSRVVVLHGFYCIFPFVCVLASLLHGGIGWSWHFLSFNESYLSSLAGIYGTIIHCYMTGENPVS